VHLVVSVWALGLRAVALNRRSSVHQSLFGIPIICLEWSQKCHRVKFNDMKILLARIAVVNSLEQAGTRVAGGGREIATGF